MVSAIVCVLVGKYMEGKVPSNLKVLFFFFSSSLAFMDCSNSELTSETPSIQFILHGGSVHHMTSA
jgi:hypothetical membrane protein